jgi:hypothetical protein
MDTRVQCFSETISNLFLYKFFFFLSNHACKAAIVFFCAHLFSTVMIKHSWFGFLSHISEIKSVFNCLCKIIEITVENKWAHKNTIADLHAWFEKKKKNLCGSKFELVSEKTNMSQIKYNYNIFFTSGYKTISYNWK